MSTEEREINQKFDFYELMKSESESSLDTVSDNLTDSNDEDDYLSMMKEISEEEVSKMVYGASSDSSESSANQSGSSNVSISRTKTNSDGTISTESTQSIYSTSESNSSVDQTNSDVKIGTDD